MQNKYFRLTVLTKMKNHPQYTVMLLYLKTDLKAFISPAIQSLGIQYIYIYK